MRLGVISSEGRVHVGVEVERAIVRIFDEAEQYIVAVSPYLDPWEDVDRAVVRAVQRGVKDIQFIVRGRVKWGYEQMDSLKWLDNLGVKISWVEDLHAKIYMNERAVLLSSMNLTESSVGNLEIACTVTEPEAYHKVWRYVSENIAFFPLPEGRQPVEEHAGAVLAGFCISCRAGIGLDRRFPLCAKHSALWQNRFRGNYCLMCGEGAKTSLYKPLCDSCYDHNGV